jgi:lipoprotein-anchoring transpeptidase ErfK/SrfK
MRLWVTFALIATLAGAAPHPARQKKRPTKGHAERTVQPQPMQIDVAEVNNPNQPELDIGAKGSGVLRAEILLDRAHFSCGQIDGNFGTNLQKTAAAFQHDRHMEMTGRIDAATWAALNGDNAPAITSYTITDDDVKGPFVTVPHDMMKQAELEHLGYASPLDALGEKFHSSPAILKALNPNAEFGSAGQQLQVPNVMVMPPSGTAARVFVSKEERSVRAYDEDGKLLGFYMATIGSEHDPLPIGNWKINGVQRNPEFHYNASLFWDAKNKDERATIKPGPRNPVGVVWIDLSKPHYGIHGTPDPSKIGHTFSHGCIRLTNWDASELASLVKPGTPAILKE